MRRIGFSALVVLGLVAVGRAESVYFDDIRIPMRDGVNLAADIYLPSNRTEKIGCLLEFSPYQVTKAASAAAHGTDRAEAWGVAQVWVDCRGICHSEGVFEPWEKRLTDDAFDLLEWISRQEWSNGRVVTVGGSYPGWTQFACLKSGHHALVAAAPSVITLGAYTVSFQNGVLAPIFQQGWHTGQAGADSWAELARHPDRSDFYWREREFLGKLAKSKARVLLQAGWFDMLGVETFRTFAQLPKGSIVRVGPWSHGINTFDRPDFSYADKNAEVTEELEDEFLRSALEGRESSLVAAQPRIQVYTMGRNVWRELDAWPARGTIERRLFLSASEGGRSLVWESPRVGSAAFDYYPDDPTPSKGGRIIGAGGQYDQREIEARADVLSFTSDVLAEELEVTGDVRASLTVASTAPESDVVVRLVDVCPDGRALGVLEGIYRAKFIPGRSRRLDWFLDITSYVFQPGHRIRVDIAGAAAPHFAKSPNAATETISFGGADASCVILPIAPCSNP